MNKKIVLLLCILMPLTALAQRQKQYQLIKTDGTPVSEIYPYISRPIGEKALFGMDGKAGFLDLSGQVLLPPTFDYRTIEMNSKYRQLGMFVPFNSEGKCALMNDRFELITPYIYEFLEMDPHNIIVARKGEHRGIIDTLGNELTPFIYDKVGYYDNGFIQVYKDEKEGVVYKNGRQVIPFTKARHGIKFGLPPYIEDLMSVTINEKCGLIDSTGREIYPFIYEAIRKEFNYKVDLLYLVKRKGTFDHKVEIGVGDVKGNIILEPIYEKVRLFEEGIVTLKNGEYSLFDLQGNLKMSTGRAILLSKYACIEIYEESGVRQFYDCEGSLLSPLKKDPSLPESDYWKVFTDKQTGLEGCMDISTGDVFIPAQYEELSYIANSPRWLRAATHKGKKGIIDSKGNIVIPIEYQDIIGLNDEHCILVKGNKGALSDYEGNLLTGYDFVHIDTMGYGYTSGSDSTAVHVDLPVYAVAKGRRCGIISKEGKELLPCEYQIDGSALFKVLSKGLIVLKKKGKYGLFDSQKAEIVLPCEYDDLEEDGSRSGYILIEKKSKWGVLDKNGREILPCIYPYAPRILGGKAILIKGNNEREGVADLNGNIVIPLEYLEIDIYHDDILRVYNIKVE